MEFKIYSKGPVSMSVCASKELSKEEVEKRANEENPTGIESNWKTSENKFESGEDNPCLCNTSPKTHLHYLLNC